MTEENAKQIFYRTTAFAEQWQCLVLKEIYDIDFFQHKKVVEDNFAWRSRELFNKIRGGGMKEGHGSMFREMRKRAMDQSTGFRPMNHHARCVCEYCGRRGDRFYYWGSWVTGVLAAMLILTCIVNQVLWKHPNNRRSHENTHSGESFVISRIGR